MTWKCRLTEYKKDKSLWEVGDMFYGPSKDQMSMRGEYSMWIYLQCRFLSEHYWSNNSHRRPLFVVLPGHHLFCLDGKQWLGGQQFGGWTVIGDAPNITVGPSINVHGLYHGWLCNGELSDDVESRYYDEKGNYAGIKTQGPGT